MECVPIYIQLIVRVEDIFYKMFLMSSIIRSLPWLPSHFLAIAFYYLFILLFGKKKDMTQELEWEREM